MTRLAGRLSELAGDGRKALVTFITAGDPELAVTVSALHAIVAGGADILELGVPFSDPEGEGPAIQASSERALRNGMTLATALQMVGEFRAEDATTPIVLMGYLNSVLAMGVETFAQAAGEAGVDGLIMVNLPPEEADLLKTALAANGIDLVFLVAPTTTPERAQLIIDNAAGFIYYISLKGITGADHLDVRSVVAKVHDLKARTDIPIMVGFGIKDAATAKAVAAHADGVVVGSVLVNEMAQGKDVATTCSTLRAMVAELRAAIDSHQDPS
jgi:tryptophan synthase alpha chain